MKLLSITMIIILALLLFIFLLTYILFRIIFYVPDRDPNDDSYRIPKDKKYEPYVELLVKWMKNFRTMPHEVFSITSFDGLSLYGNYYEYEPGAPIELMFHGYRGTAEHDLSVGIQRCFSMGHSALIVDQRASSRSGGNVISFGINEHRDCLSWIDFMVSHFGPDVKIIPGGISMGASTVLMAAGHPLPPNVLYVMADCGYSSANEIIKKCARQIHLPANFFYPFVKLAAKIWGHFDLEETSPAEAMKTCKVPVVFIHGEADDFVPHEMSIKNYEACQAPKKLLLVPGAFHGVSYITDKEGYINALLEVKNMASKNSLTNI